MPHAESLSVRGRGRAPLRQFRACLVDTLLAVALAGPGAVAAQTTYRITLVPGADCGPGGPCVASPTALNNAGWLVGGTRDAQGLQRAFVWTPAGGTVVLGALDPAEPSVARGINDAGQVVGISGNRSFVWDAGSGMWDIGAPAGAAQVLAQAINPSGVVAGYVVDGAGDLRTAFRWRPGFAWQLLPGTDASGAPLGSGAYAITSSGGLAGGVVTDDSGTARAAVWQSGTGWSLLGDSASAAYAANDLGVAVGVDQTTHQATWWSGGTSIELGHLPGGTSGVAYGVNDAGWVVGYDAGPSGNRAFAWSAATGMLALQDQVDPADPWWGRVSIVNARAINDNGQIVAAGSVDGRPWGLLLTPVPEPGPGWLTLAGLAALLLKARRAGSQRQAAGARES